MGPYNINTLYLRCLHRVFYTYDELYYEDFICSNKRISTIGSWLYCETSQTSDVVTLL